MLKLRILTISILLPLFIWLLLFASNPTFLWVTAIIISLAAFEWFKLAKINNLTNFIFSLVYLAIIYFFMVDKWLLFNNTSYITFIVKLAGIFWVIMFLDVILYSYSSSLTVSNLRLWHETKSGGFSRVVRRSGSCLFALIPSWLALNYLKIHHKHLLVFACSIIIAADLGAYIVGKLFGKHKLTRLSPGKTWEGLLGGYIGSLLVAAVYLMTLNINSNLSAVYILKIILLTSITFIFSVVGDLFESLLKRIADVKDSGSILPGHGGILDRIDSFCAGIPIFLLGVLLLNPYMV